MEFYDSDSEGSYCDEDFVEEESLDDESESMEEWN